MEIKKIFSQHKGDIWISAMTMWIVHSLQHEPHLVRVQWTHVVASVTSQVRALALNIMHTGVWCSSLVNTLTFHLESNSRRASAELFNVPPVRSLACALLQPALSRACTAAQPSGACGSTGPQSRLEITDRSTPPGQSAATEDGETEPWDRDKGRC